MTWMKDMGLDELARGLVWGVYARTSRALVHWEEAIELYNEVIDKPESPMPDGIIARGVWSAMRQTRSLAIRDRDGALMERAWVRHINNVSYAHLIVWPDEQLDPALDFALNEAWEDAVLYPHEGDGYVRLDDPYTVIDSSAWTCDPPLSQRLTYQPPPTWVDVSGRSRASGVMGEFELLVQPHKASEYARKLVEHAKRCQSIDGQVHWLDAARAVAQHIGDEDAREAMMGVIQDAERRLI